MSNSNLCISLFENKISNNEMPRRFKAVRRSQSKNKYLSFDESIHKTMSEFNKLLAQKEKQTLKNLNNLLEKNWVNDGYESKEEEQKFKIRAYFMLSNYFHNPLDIGLNSLLINKNISQRINDKTLVFAKVDKVYERTDGGIEVIDYKSGYLINHTDNFSLDLRTAILTELVASKINKYPDYISYYYLSYNKKFTHQISRDDYKKIPRLISEIV